jgi:hypothetical protein
MTRYSCIHKEFANRLPGSPQEVLSNPEKYLGPNWEAVINFWLYLDTLTQEQWWVVRERNLCLSAIEHNIAGDKVHDATSSKRRGGTLKPRIKYAYDAADSAYYSVYYVNAITRWATLELISLDKLLEQGYQPVFFPMFLNL